MNEFTTWDLLIGFFDQLFTRHQWLVALMSWTGVTILWEGVVRRSTARRGLAFMLWKEVQFNRQIAFKHLVNATLGANDAVPVNLRFSDVAFSALTARLSELPKAIIGPAIQYYEMVQTMNTMGRDYAEMFERYRETERHKSEYPVDALVRQRQVLTSAFSGYKYGLDRLVAHSSGLERQLGAAATLGGARIYALKARIEEAKL
jgi:hypothetical protein